MCLLGFPGVSDRKESACNAEDPGLIPGSERFQEGNGYPLQYSCLENPMDRGAWWATVHGVAKSQTRLSDKLFHFSVYNWMIQLPIFVSFYVSGFFHIIYLIVFILIRGLPRWCSGKEFACQYRRCRRLWFDPWVEKIPWYRKWWPTPIFWPGKFHGKWSLEGYIQSMGL